MAGIFAFTNLTPHQRPKVYRNNNFSPLEEYDEEEFLKEFRVTKAEAKGLCDLLKGDLPCRGNRRCDLTLEQKVLISLKTLGTGSFQNSSKDYFGVSQPVVSKTLSQFVDAMVKHSDEFILMPRNQAEINSIKSEMYKDSGFPGAIGLIDGTHIPINVPPIGEYMYVNRKKFHSINVQAVCDHNAVFLDVVAQWPGSHHDSFILQASTIYDRFLHNEFGTAWLLEDSGYPLKDWLMTPISDPQSAEERRYNRAHRKTRSKVERSFGILKSRWRILDHTGGAMCYLPAKVCKIFVTCCILHNVCRRNGTPLVDGPDVLPPTISDETISTSSNASGERRRQQLIHMIRE